MKLKMKVMVFIQNLLVSIKNNMNMTDNILEFEHLYWKMMEHEQKLKDSALTFKLLFGTCINDDDRKLTLTLYVVI